MLPGEIWIREIIEINPDYYELFYVQKIVLDKLGKHRNDLILLGCNWGEYSYSFGDKVNIDSSLIKNGQWRKLA